MNIKHRERVFVSRLHTAKLNEVPNERTRLGTIPNKYANRPDLIANLFYNNSRELVRLMIVNNISDPFEGFNSNDQIYIP